MVAPEFSACSHVLLCPRHYRNVDLREYLSEEVQAVHKNTTYDLIANIVHDGKPSEGSYRIHVLHHVSAPAGSCGSRRCPLARGGPLSGLEH